MTEYVCMWHLYKNTFYYINCKKYQRAVKLASLILCTASKNILQHHIAFPSVFVLLLILPKRNMVDPTKCVTSFNKYQLVALYHHHQGGR